MQSSDDDEEIEIISKSALKREHLAIKALGETLIGLSERQLGRFPLGANAREAIAAGRRLKHGALQRHLRHLANLLTEEDLPAIRQTLAQIQEPQRADVRLLHEVERWRDALLGGDDDCLGLIAGVCPAINLDALRKLVHEARLERAAGRPPRFARQLFGFLREARQRAASAPTPES